MIAEFKQVIEGNSTSGEVFWQVLTGLLARHIVATAVMLLIDVLVFGAWLPHVMTESWSIYILRNSSLGTIWFVYDVCDMLCEFRDAHASGNDGSSGEPPPRGPSGPPPPYEEVMMHENFLSSAPPPSYEEVIMYENFLPSAPPYDELDNNSHIAST